MSNDLRCGCSTRRTRTVTIHNLGFRLDRGGTSDGLSNSSTTRLGQCFGDCSNGLSDELRLSRGGICDRDRESRSGLSDCLNLSRRGLNYGDG